MELKHPKLTDLLRQAYSAEKAAVQQIEQDEWEHRKNVLIIMQ